MGGAEYSISSAIVSRRAQGAYEGRFQPLAPGLVRRGHSRAGQGQQRCIAGRNSDSEFAGNSSE